MADLISTSDLPLLGSFQNAWGGFLWAVGAWVWSLGLPIAAIGSLLTAAHRLRGTTLVAPLVWATVPNLLLLSLPWGAFWRELPSLNWQQVFLAGISSFCPAMALLGAKRPQHIAWQFIVLSLFFVAALPAFPAWIFRDQFLVHVVWKWFYLLLILIGWLNHLTTPLGLAATLWAAGQVALLWDNLPLPALPAAAAWTQCLHVARLLLIPAASILAARFLIHSSVHSNAVGWNRVWRDFRNAYGVVWAARVMQRTNALAKSQGASVTLDWHGLHAGEAEATDIEMAELEPGLRNLLRRFVSDQWIAARLSPPGLPSTR